MKKQALALVATVTLSIGMFVSPTFAEESYKVQSGDTSWEISENYDFSATELQQLNELKSTVSYPERDLTVNSTVQDESNEDTHPIKSGDTLFNIAMTYGVTVADLKTWNHLSSDLIYAGDTLAVKASAAKPGNPPPARSTPKVATTSVPAPAPAPTNASGGTYTMRATAYTAYCTGCSGTTANGTDLRANPNQKVIAVDPRVIPLGTKVWVEGYGEAIAADTGGAIKGNKIDVFIPSDGQARQWGVRTVTVKILK